ncbi:MAG: hypothetical protein ABIJ22_00170 [Patescibacteria group bacterium]
MSEADTQIPKLPKRDTAPNVVYPARDFLRRSLRDTMFGDNPELAHYARWERIERCLSAIPFPLPIVNGAMVFRQNTPDGDRSVSMRIKDCPTSAISVLEIQRIPILVGVDIDYQYLFVFFDETGAVVDGDKTLMILNPMADQKPQLTAHSFEDAFQLFNINFFYSPNEKTLRWYLAEGQQTIMGEEAELCQATTDIELRPLLIPLEIALPLADLLDKFPDKKEFIFNLINKYRLPAQNILAALDYPSDEKTKDYLYKLEAIVANQNEYHQSRVADLFYVFTELFHDTQRISDLYLSEEKGVISGNLLRQLLRQTAVKMVEGILDTYHYDPDSFSWNPALLSIVATYDLLDMVHTLPVEPRMPAEAVLSQEIEELMTQRYSQIPTTAMIVEYYLLQSILKQSDPELKKQGIVFYQALGDHLDKISSQTTGNLEQELERIVPTIVWHLKQLGITDYILIDLGCRIGRFLSPCLDQLEENGFAPIHVIGIDILPLGQPDHGKWNFLQADLSAPELPDLINSERPQVFTSTWSVLNDLKPGEQRQFFINISKMMREEDILIIDVADPASYVAEIDQFQQDHPGASAGMMERSFPGPEGEKHAKAFNITPSYRLLTLSDQADFEVINHPAYEGVQAPLNLKYTTPVGHHRMTLVLKKKKRLA